MNVAPIYCGDENAVCKSDAVNVPTLTNGHELWVMTERMRLAGGRISLGMFGDVWVCL